MLTFYLKKYFDHYLTMFMTFGVCFLTSAIFFLVLVLQNIRLDF
jgi:hypothetical protein